jgi:hypothetical protein
MTETPSDIGNEVENMKPGPDEGQDGPFFRHPAYGPPVNTLPVFITVFNNTIPIDQITLIDHTRDGSIVIYVGDIQPKRVGLSGEQAKRFMEVLGEHTLHLSADPMPDEK